MKGSDIHTILIPTGLVGKTYVPHRTARKNRTVKSHVPDLQYGSMHACMWCRVLLYYVYDKQCYSCTAIEYSMG